MMTLTQIHAEAAYRAERTATASAPRRWRRARPDAHDHAGFPRPAHATAVHRVAWVGAGATPRTGALGPA